MSNILSPAQQPSLVIDCKRNRIRVHKRTLHILGDPKYVQILINPDTKCIAFRTSTDKHAERVRWETIGGKQCCEFYSKYLIKQIRSVLFDADKVQVYRIIGQFVAREELVYFCANEAVPISDYEEDLE